MRNEKDFYGRYNEFVYIQDYVKFSSQVVGVHFNVNICVNFQGYEVIFPIYNTKLCSTNNTF